LFGNDAKLQERLFQKPGTANPKSSNPSTSVQTVDEKTASGSGNATLKSLTLSRPRQKKRPPTKPLKDHFAQDLSAHSSASSLMFAQDGDGVKFMASNTNLFEDDEDVSMHLVIIPTHHS
jgi:hypothetical protein